MRGQYTQVDSGYDSAEWTQTGGAVNYDVSAQTLFVNCKVPKHVMIRTDQTITVRFNLTNAPAITVSANTAFDLDGFGFYALFVTTTVDTAIKILFTA